MRRTLIPAILLLAACAEEVPPPVYQAVAVADLAARISYHRPSGR